MWLLFAWLLLANQNVDKDPIVRDVIDLSQSVGTIGTVAAASVAAYLLGAISQAVADGLRNFMLIPGRVRTALEESGGSWFADDSVPPFGKPSEWVRDSIEASFGLAPGADVLRHAVASAAGVRRGSGSNPRMMRGRSALIPPMTSSVGGT